MLFEKKNDGSFVSVRGTIENSDELPILPPSSPLSDAEFQGSVIDDSGASNDQGYISGSDRQDTQADMQQTSISEDNSLNEPTTEEYLLTIAKEIDKVNLKVDSIAKWIRDFYTRFSYNYDQVQKLKQIVDSDRRDITIAIGNSSRAVELASAARPDRSSKKLDSRLSEMDRIVQENKNTIRNVLLELKEVRKTSEVFVGTEELLKLNKEVKADLLDMQKLTARIKSTSDKSEQMSEEMRKSFNDLQKLGKKFESSCSNFDRIKRDVEELKLKTSQGKVATNFETFKKEVTERLNWLMSIQEKKKSEVDELRMTMAEMNSEMVADYEKRIGSMLEVIEELSRQVSGLKNGSVTPGQKNEALLLKKAQAAEALKSEFSQLQPSLSIKSQEAIRGRKASREKESRKSGKKKSGAKVKKSFNRKKKENPGGSDMGLIELPELPDLPPIDPPKK